MTAGDVARRENRTTVLIALFLRPYAREFAVKPSGHHSSISTALLARLIADMILNNMILNTAYSAAFHHAEGTALRALRHARRIGCAWHSSQSRQCFKLADSSVDHAIFAVSIGNSLAHFFVLAETNVNYLHPHFRNS